MYYVAFCLCFWYLLPFGVVAKNWWWHFFFFHNGFTEQQKQWVLCNWNIYVFLKFSQHFHYEVATKKKQHNGKQNQKKKEKDKHES